MEIKKIAIKRTWCLSLIGSLLLTAGTLQAEPSIDVDATVVSDYVFRGVDLFENKFRQDGEKITGLNVAPAFQPSVNFNLDNGFYFNVWTSFALTGREDVDTDGLYQTGPASSTTTSASLLEAAITNSSTKIDAVTAAATPTNPISALAGGSYQAPGLYNETNGLRRLDEVDLTLGYSVDSKLGTMSGGIINYVLPNTLKGVTGVDQYQEVFVGFEPAALPGLGITYYAEMNGGTAQGGTYTYIGYGYDIEVNDNFTVGLSTGAGYATANGYQGWKNVDAGVSFGFGNFSLGINAAYRPNFEFLEFSDTAGKNAPTWLTGASTQFDGLVEDPSKNNGMVNSYINSQVAAVLDPAGTIQYTYTPRQKLPRVIYYVSLGYSVSF